jgi:restriction endonuclease Mrr
LTQNNLNVLPGASLRFPASPTPVPKTGDGGIDGRGIFRVGLVSFPVVFQWLRYQGSVGSSTVRDFRGAMSGRSSATSDQH